MTPPDARPPNYWGKNAPDAYDSVASFLAAVSRGDLRVVTTETTLRLALRRPEPFYAIPCTLTEGETL